MTIDIFIKSYHADFWLLQLALKTITKNVTGYNNIVLLIPEDEKELFDTRGMPERTLIYYVPDKIPGWLGQQVFKMKAFEYCHADFIMFSDSDVFFDHPINLQDYVKDNKPEILYTSWDLVGDAICWKEPTEAFIKEPVEHERMRRNNQIIHRQTLVNIDKYEPNLENIILSSHRWSEFNAMAAYANKYEHDKYKWTDTKDWEYVPPLGIQTWSHANKNGDLMHLKEYCKILETIIISFGLPLPQ